MKYTYEYFKNGMPQWKRKKDPILSKLFYRKLSFLTASACANFGISANTVSYASTIVALCAPILFLIDNFYVKIIAAILVNIWLIMDCTDGNLARSIGSQIYGDFADSASSYILVAFICTCMGVSVYQTGGIFLDKGCAWTIFIGAIASSSDTLMRLIYQKYKAVTKELEEQGIIEKEQDIRTDHVNAGSLRVRIEAELGIGGILPMVILVATIFNALDLVLAYCFIYYGFSCLTMTILYISKAIIHTKEYNERRQDT